MSDAMADVISGANTIVSSGDGQVHNDTAAAEHIRLLALSSDVGRALTEENSLSVALQRCTMKMVQHLDAAFARIWVLEEDGDTLELRASAGLYTHLDGAHGRVPVGKFKIGLIAQERKPHLTNSVQGDPRVGDQEWARREGMVSFAGHPLIVADRLIGVMALFARHPLPDATLAALAAIANQIAVGIERQQVQLKLQEQTEALATIHRIGQALSAELDLEKLVQAATDAATHLTGAQFGAFFYNTINEQGESLTLYTLSGAPPEAFSSFPMPRNTAVFAPTFKGEGTMRSRDITQDERYGKNPPYEGMPAGHLPVRSFLAVSVVSRSGEVMGALFFGHAQPGIFTARHEQIVEGLASQTAIAIDNARLYQQAQQEIVARERAQLALRESEKQLRLVMDTVPVLISYVDDQHRYRFNNKTYADWLGHSPDHINGKHVAEVVGEEAYQAVQKQIEAALDGQNVVCEREMYYRGSEPRFVHSEFVPDRGDQGEIKGFVAVVSDITEQKRQRDALSESERRYRFMAESIPQIIWTARPDGGVDYYNQRWMEYTGLTLEQMQDWGWRACPHPDDLQAVIDAWQESLRTGDDYVVECRICSKEGAYRWFLSRANAMKDANGGILKWFGTTTDIDDQKRGQERERLLGQLSEQIRASIDPQEVLWATVNTIGRYLQTSRCYFVDVDLAGGRATIGRDYCHSVESWAGEYPLSSFGEAVIANLSQGRTVAIADTKVDPRTAPFYDIAYRPYAIRAYLAVPMIENGNWTASLVVSVAGTPRDWTADEIELLETAAERTQLAVDNARLWQAERERSEQLARAIQEVHHRVKNSLQGVSALLEMQLPWDSDMVSVATVQEGLNQIKTIALVHDLLSRDQPIGAVNAAQVLTSLVELLSPGLKTMEHPVPILLQTEAVLIPTKAATALALAVNELISNAVKHNRILDREDARSYEAIEVNLTKQNGSIHVTARDNGQGFPSGFNPKQDANIGLELVYTLVEHDLHGAITFSNRGGKDEDSDEHGGNVEIVFGEDAPG